MKNKVLSYEERFFPHMQEGFTVEEFAKIAGWNLESVRQACRNYVDSHGRQSRLPEGFYAVKPQKNWVIKFKKAPFIYSPRTDQRSFDAIGNPLFVNSIDTFLDYDPSEIAATNIIIVNLEKTERLLIYNILDYIEVSQPEKGLFLYIGDILIYELVSYLYRKRKKSKIKVALKILTGLLDIADIHFSYHIRKAMKDEANFCLHCGARLNEKTIQTLNNENFSSLNVEIESLFRKHYFCSKAHRNNFDNPSRNNSVQRLIDFNMNNIHTSIVNGSNALLKLAGNICSDIEEIVDGKKPSAKNGKTQVWSRELDLYRSLKKYFFKFENYDEFNFDQVMIEDFIRSQFKGNKGTQRYPDTFLKNFETGRLISLIMQSIHAEYN